jgi:outer membrane lipoprotein-sorting protein
VKLLGTEIAASAAGADAKVKNAQTQKKNKIRKGLGNQLPQLFILILTILTPNEYRWVMRRAKSDVA